MTTATQRAYDNADQYHADNGTIGQTMMRDFRESPLGYYGRYVTGELADQATPEKTLGSAFHSCMQDPDGYRERMYELPAEFLDGVPINRRLKLHREFLAKLQAQAEEKGLIVIQPGEVEDIELMARQVWANPAVADLLSLPGVERELPVRWQHPETGLWLKAMADVWVPSERTVINYKTSCEWTYWGVRRQARQLQWQAIDAHYTDGFNADRHLFVVIHNAAPFEAMVYQLDPDSQTWGFEMNEQTLGDIKRSLDSGYWQAEGHGEIVELSL